MLTEICADIRNWFEVPDGRHFGRFNISGGSLEPIDFLQYGQYFRVVGSVFNDGVYQFPASGLTDESFDGAIWAMAVPPAVIAIAEEIKAYTESDAGKPTGYTAESFGGYSYSKATDSNGAPLTWQEVYRSRLNKWRKL